MPGDHIWVSLQFPEEREAIVSFTKMLSSFSDLISKDVLREGKISSGGIELLSVSAYNEIERYFKNERLKSVLGGNCGLYAGDKLTTSLYEYGVITNSNIEGTYSFLSHGSVKSPFFTRFGAMYGETQRIPCSFNIS